MKLGSQDDDMQKDMEEENRMQVNLPYKIYTITLLKLAAGATVHPNRFT